MSRTRRNDREAKNIKIASETMKASALALDATPGACRAVINANAVAAI